MRHGCIEVEGGVPHETGRGRIFAFFPCRNMGGVMVLQSPLAGRRSRFRVAFALQGHADESDLPCRFAEAHEDIKGFGSMNSLFGNDPARSQDWNNFKAGRSMLTPAQRGKCCHFRFVTASAITIFPITALVAGRKSLSQLT